MMAIQTFLMDGESYNVSVLKLTRKFSVQDTDKSGRVRSGGMYRDIIGAYYNYTMTVAAKNGDQEALDAFWEAISQPVESHVCVFPYGQATLTQTMYATSGEQDLMLMTEGKNYWDEISINFVAMKPKVVP